MERFEFNSETGANSNRKNGITRHGIMELLPWGAPVGDRELITLAIFGPQGADRGGVVLDKATAGKLGAALLKWAGADRYEEGHERGYFTGYEEGKKAGGLREVHED